ncbi:MAG TPA: RusA family crossover junction endodeoxyribonuclease [Alphaproteobacteria bacterium]|nr:RusA family crossover junction endodeoxyribonuclease [Alphaproteobacteria bacterium]
MAYINYIIHGVPYSRNKSRGKTDAADKWSQQVLEQTNHLPRVKEACALKVTFLLPPDKFPKDFPYGPDLDNLLKRFMDALNETVFSETPGGDSCVVLLTVMKTKVANYEESGVHLELLPVSVA